MSCDLKTSVVLSPHDCLGESIWELLIEQKHFWCLFLILPWLDWVCFLLNTRHMLYIKPNHWYIKSSILNIWTHCLLLISNVLKLVCPSHDKWPTGFNVYFLEDLLRSARVVPWTRMASWPCTSCPGTRPRSLLTKCSTCLMPTEMELSALKWVIGMLWLFLKQGWRVL